jgi:hypothetical protein
MPTDQELDQQKQTRDALVRMQNFDAETLRREADLGSHLNFSPVTESAARLVELYKRLSATALDDFPLPDLQAIRNQADNDFNIFNQILEFNPTAGSPQQQRQQLMQQVQAAYHPAFKALHPYISYSLHRAADFQRLDREARATFQQIRDEATAVTQDLQATRDEAKHVLEDVRKVAAEHGVTQQAAYFKEAADDHERQAGSWKKWTINVSIGLGAYSLATFVLHKLPWIAPATAYETVQMAVSKVLVFGVMSYMLYLCAKNFLSHKHNAIINRHRQNALMTYKALVDAAGDTANRDVVLHQAATCIFGPQPTGYSGQGDGQAPSSKSIVEFLSRPLSEME